MLIQGTILFRATFQPQESEGQLISWNTGILEYPSLFKQNSDFATTIVGFEGYHQNDVKIWSKDAPILASFSDFRRYLRSSGNKLGIGAWYQEADKTLHLARSIFGTHPLYYLLVPGQICLFSTHLQSLLKSAKEAGVSVALSKSRLQAFLTFGQDQFSDYQGETFYQEIKCVLPGHILTVTPSGCSSVPYTSFQLPQSNESLAGYAEHFKTLLEQAVRNALPTDNSPIGSHLSGGLDSSSVSSFTRMLAPESALHTFYYNTQGAGSNDRDYALEVARHIGSDHHEISISDDHLGAVTSHTRILGYPQFAFVSPTFYDGVYKLASDLGCRTVLNGNGGDTIVGSGFEYLTVLYQQKNWPLLKELLSKRTHYFTKADQYKNWDQLSFRQRNRIVEQNFIYHRLSESVRKTGVRQLAALYRELSAHFELDPGYFITRGFRAFAKRLKGDVLPPSSLLRREFLEIAGDTSTQGKGLSTSLRGDLPDIFRPPFEEIFSRHTVCQNENRVILARHYGFTIRSPFFDKSLFELCMSIPEVIKFGDGSGRMHFREAMKGILPDSVRLRAQKAHVGQRGKTATLQLYAQARELLYDTEEVWQYVDKAEFEATVKFLQTDHLPIENYNRSLFHVTRTVSVAAWLEWLKSEKITR